MLRGKLTISVPGIERKANSFYNGEKLNMSVLNVEWVSSRACMKASLELNWSYDANPSTYFMRYWISYLNILSTH